MKRTTYSGTNTFTYEDTSHEDGLEYTVEYRYSGYYDPGRTYGPPENCYPPEGDHEVEIDKIEPMPPKWLFEKIEEALMEWSEENDHGDEPDEPEYEHDVDRDDRRDEAAEWGGMDV